MERSDYLAFLHYRPEFEHHLLYMMTLPGFNVDLKNRMRTAVMMYSKNGSDLKLKAFLDAGADVNFKDKNTQTPLIHASNNGHVECVRALLDAGADVQAKDKYGRTALMFASENGHWNVCVPYWTPERMQARRISMGRQPLRLQGKARVER